MKYISNTSTSKEFIDNRSQYSLPHVDFSNDTATVFYKNNRDEEYLAYNKSDSLDGCILLNPTNISYNSECTKYEYLTFSLTVDKIYIDGTTETGVNINILMYIDDDTLPSDVFKYKGLEIPYTITIKQPTNALTYTINNNVISFKLTKLNENCKNILNKGKLYLVIENDSLHNTGNANSENAYLLGRNKHSDQRIKKTRLKYRAESWSSNVDKGFDFAQQNVIKLTRLGQTGKFTIDSDFIYLCINEANSHALYHWWNYDNSRDFNMEYKFTLYSNIGDGRFKHIDAEHFMVYNIFSDNRTIEKIE